MTQQTQQSSSSSGGYVQPDPRQTQRASDAQTLRNPERRR